MKGLFCRRAGILALTVIVCFFGDARAEAKPARLLDLVDTVSANRIMTKFAAMVQASDLTTFLSSRGPFTLFVPTDAAFDRMTPEQFNTLLQPQNQERLQHILLFHLVNGKRLYAKDLLTLHDLLSCEGTQLAIHKSRSGAQLVMKARIVHADIRCLNGVIHEIDTVLMPPEASLPPLLASPPPTSTTNTPPMTGQTNTPDVSIPSPPATEGTNAEPPVPPPALEITPH
jgi:uncharacterized surface protein with fasciclin (FAS1) repeats